MHALFSAIFDFLYFICTILPFCTPDVFSRVFSGVAFSDFFFVAMFAGCLQLFFKKVERERLR